MINSATTNQHVSETALGNTPHKSPKLSNQVSVEKKTKTKPLSEIWKVMPQESTNLKDPEPQQLLCPLS